MTMQFGLTKPYNTRRHHVHNNNYWGLSVALSCLCVDDGGRSPHELHSVNNLLVSPLLRGIWAFHTTLNWGADRLLVDLFF